jgi:RNA recognition motif-containing protein
MMVKIFIGGFPLNMDEMGLAQLVSPHGEISIMKIVRDKQTRKCKGYAFLEMKDEDAAISVMAALDGQPMGDRVLTVKLAPEQPEAPAPRYQKLTRPGPGEPFKKKRPRRPGP